MDTTSDTVQNKQANKQNTQTHTHTYIHTRIRMRPIKNRKTLFQNIEAGKLRILRKY